MYRSSLALLLLVTACDADPAAVTGVIMKTEPSPLAAEPSDAGEPAPVVAPHAREPAQRAPSDPPTEEAPPKNNGQIQPNGCFPDYRDLGACCAPPLDPGDCNCKTGNLCARSCKYDSNHVAEVAVFCVDGGLP